MSYFDDQMDAWFDNDCQGTIEDTDPYDVPETYQSKPEAKTNAKPQPKRKRAKPC